MKELFKVICDIFTDKNQYQQQIIATQQEYACLIFYKGQDRIVLHSDGTWEYRR